MEGIIARYIGVVLGKAAKLEKVVRNRKKMTFGPYSRKTRKYWDKTFFTETCSRFVRLQ